MDDTFEAGSMKFKMLGSFTSLDSFTFVKSIPDKRFYFINSKTGWVNELLGYPVFSSSQKEFACFGNSDRGDEIRLCKFKGGKIEIYSSSIIDKKVFEISCVMDNSMYIKDSSNHYWKYQLNWEK